MQIEEVPRPKVWQDIDTLPIAIKVSLFAQDASLVQQNSVPSVKSFLIFPTPGNNTSPQKDVRLRFLYTHPFGKASRFQKSTHNIYIFSNNSKHKTLFLLLLYHILFTSHPPGFFLVPFTYKMEPHGKPMDDPRWTFI